VPTYYTINDLEREQQQMKAIEQAKLTLEDGLCFAGHYRKKNHLLGSARNGFRRRLGQTGQEDLAAAAAAAKGDIPMPVKRNGMHHATPQQ
jgi:hypothetical protein